MHPAHFRIGVARAQASPPPLLEARDGRIVEGHLIGQSPRRPALLAQADAEFGFFAGDQTGIEAARLLEGLDAHEAVAADLGHLAWSTIPFEIAQPVVDRLTGKPLASPSAHHRS